VIDISNVADDDDDDDADADADDDYVDIWTMDEEVLLAAAGIAHHFANPDRTEWGWRRREVLEEDASGSSDWDLDEDEEDDEDI
jgi:hypothetical protein